MKSGTGAADSCAGWWRNGRHLIRVTLAPKAGSRLLHGLPRERRSDSTNNKVNHGNQRIRHFLRALYLDLAGVTQEMIFQSLCNYSRESQALAQINAIKRRQANPTDTSGVVMTLGDQEAEAPTAGGAKGNDGRNSAKEP